MSKSASLWYVSTCVAGLFLSAVSGCGDRNVSRVSGNVSFDGRPVPLGMVVFEPTAGGSHPGSITLKDGKYEADPEMGLVPGEYLVRITAPDLSKSNPNANAGPNDPAPVIIPLLPPAWNVQSQLTVELQPGDNTVHFRGSRTEPPTVEKGE